MREVRMHGYITAEMKVETVSDLRDLIEWCNEHAVPGETGLDWGNGVVWLLLTGDRDVDATWIECGDHLSGDERFDILVETHNHE